jgi:hypothetical protein
MEGHTKKILKSWFNKGVEKASRYITIPAGTTLYRSADNICTYQKNTICSMKAVCTDTRKKGVYFSTYILQSLGMCVEYNRDLELGIFFTTEPITVRVGKYSYKYINPDRYFNSDYREKAANEILADEIIGHFNNESEPIIKYDDAYGNKLYADMTGQKDTDGELFITEDADLKKIRLISTYKIDKNRLLEYFKSLGWKLPSNSLEYLKSGALRPTICSKKAGKRITRRFRKNK